jgi:DNA-binding NarL/FixJ family response regulator
LVGVVPAAAAVGGAVTIRVGLADDQALVRDGLRVQLGYADGIEVVGVVADGSQAVELARTLMPDVLIMDVRMPVLDGLEATRRIVADPATANVRVLVLTTFDVDELVYGALRAGASGFLLKDVSPEELVRAVRVVADGERCSPRR